ncbi:MAG: 50S ribosomal protein L11 methyltransferase [Ignavibacteriae bacterium]|nr:50S ribosomal protein L11 methyltransferase [Ignavibacteriota bacterium]NOG99976.1 50S ribosomal protein L11 methyltransferase [Ignavibacteriota bacterium]
MKEYKKFEITAIPFNIDLISGILWELDITGINEDYNKLLVFADSNSRVNANSINAQLESLVKNNLLESFSVKENTLTDKNWNEEWEKTINVIPISERIVIKPSFRRYTPKNNEIVLEIDPKMSFGTGEHQTTKLVIKMLEKFVQAEQKILDVGSGTGVLAIAAVKLGGGKAIAIDNDEWCFENGIENVNANNCSDKIEIKHAEIADITEDNFDLITANINKNILLNIADDLISKLADNGILILSGILAQDEQDILKCYESSGVKLIGKEKMDEWISLALKHSK